MRGRSTKGQSEAGHFVGVATEEALRRSHMVVVALLQQARAGSDEGDADAVRFALNEAFDELLRAGWTLDHAHASLRGEDCECRAQCLTHEDRMEWFRGQKAWLSKLRGARVETKDEEVAT